MRSHPQATSARKWASQASSRTIRLHEDQCAGTIYAYQIRYHSKMSKAPASRDTNLVFGEVSAFNPYSLIADNPIKRPDLA